MATDLNGNVIPGSEDMSPARPQTAPPPFLAGALGGGAQQAPPPQAGMPAPGVPQMGMLPSAPQPTGPPPTNRATSDAIQRLMGFVEGPTPEAEKPKKTPKLAWMLAGLSDALALYSHMRKGPKQYYYDRHGKLKYFRAPNDSQATIGLTAQLAFAPAITRRKQAEEQAKLRQEMRLKLAPQITQLMVEEMKKEKPTHSPEVQTYYDISDMQDKGLVPKGTRETYVQGLAKHWKGEQSINSNPELAAKIAELRGAGKNEEADRLTQAVKDIAAAGDAGKPAKGEMTEYQRGQLSLAKGREKRIANKAREDALRKAWGADVASATKAREALQTSYSKWLEQNSGLIVEGTQMTGSPVPITNESALQGVKTAGPGNRTPQEIMTYKRLQREMEAREGAIKAALDREARAQQALDDKLRRHFGLPADEPLPSGVGADEESGEMPGEPDEAEPGEPGMALETPGSIGPPGTRKTLPGDFKMIDGSILSEWTQADFDALQKADPASYKQVMQHLQSALQGAP